MGDWATWVFVGLMIHIAAQAITAVLFMGVLRRRNDGGVNCGSTPRAAVLLCLRGADPSLRETIEGLCRQDYGDYRVIAVVDGEDDPARAVVEGTVKRLDARHVRVVMLKTRRQTCSLKCSSLLEGLGHVDESCEIIAISDADTRPHAGWLRELVAAFDDERVGAATGNRWFAPPYTSWGSVVRYLWNAAAVVQMYFYRIPWGGTLALRREVIEQLRLAGYWEKAFCEDTMLFSLLRRRKWRIRFVPSLIMINRETFGLAACCRWVHRQLFVARLYHPLWVAVAGHAILTVLLLALALILIVAEAAREPKRDLAMLVTGLLFYWVALFVLALWMEGVVRSVAASRGEGLPRLTGPALLRVFAAIPLTHAVHITALMGAQWTRKIMWRGIGYTVRGPWKVHMEEYRPFKEAGTDSNANSSL